MTEKSIKPKLLILDIETMMGQAYIWRMYEEVTNINMLIDPVSIISWAAKWVGDEHTYFDSVQRNTFEGMMENLWHLMDEAEVVMGINSNRFDVRHINAAFFKLDMAPPSPYRKVDLQQHYRRNMSFMSNKLDYVAEVAGLGNKLEHEGLGLWLKCREGDKEAWRVMEEYNVRDVELTEQLYYRLRPWLPYTVNQSIEGGHVCSECGSANLQSRGPRPAITQVYDRWSCNDCGSWMQTVSARKNIKATLKKVQV